MKKCEMQRGKIKCILKFVLFSLLGIFVFFCPIKIGSSTAIPIDHLIDVLKKLSTQYYRYIILILSGYSVFHKIKNKKFKSFSDIFFLTMTVLGLIVCVVIVFELAPLYILDFCKSAIVATGNILCAIFLASVFVPLLVEYGLVDAVGVLCRPIMRRLFLTPGSSAVIGVSAFLGNYSTGHVVAKQMYDEGRYTEKEAFIVATGFSTCSVGLMINLSNYLGIREYWGGYIATVLFVTFATTVITARIFPTSRKPEKYVEGKQCGEKELAYSRNILCEAWYAGLKRADTAQSPIYAVCSILRRVYPIISEVAGTSTFVIVCGLIIASNTKIFAIIGAVIYPILKIAGIEAAEISVMINAIGASILEPVIAGIICDGQALSIEARWVVAVVPYSAIVFFAGFIPSIISSGIKCKLWEAIVIWFERMIIGSILTIIIAAIVF